MNHCLACFLLHPLTELPGSGPPRISLLRIFSCRSDGLLANGSLGEQSETARNEIRHLRDR